MKIDKHGFIKEMVLETHSNLNGKFTLEINQSPFGDLAIIYKHDTSEVGLMLKRKSGYRSKYFDNSVEDKELFIKNSEKALRWFYEEAM